jgi:predicted metal-dependent peptidase
MNKGEVLSKISKTLMLKEPFYGFFLIMLNKVWSKQVPTAGVSKNGVNYQLAINEDFFASLSDDHKLGLIKHELLHICFFHLAKWFEFYDKKLANIAMDLEINQFIDSQYLPEGGMVLEMFPELELEAKKGTHYYYDKLKQAKEEKQKNGTSGSPMLDNLLDQAEGGQQGEGMPKLPDHGTWEEFENMSDSEQRVMENQLNRVLNEAAVQTEKKRGTIPGYIKDHLLKISQVEPPKFNWKAYIRRFVGTSTKIYTKKSKRKENVKYLDSAGIKVKMKQNLLLAIDTSGSVSDSELKEFMNEIYHIYKTGVAVTIIQCDTHIRSIEEYKGSFEMVFGGRGGTEFTPVLEYFNANRQKFNSMIYFTDGECYTHVKPKNPVLWVLSERSEMNSSLPGKVIKLEL